MKIVYENKNVEKYFTNYKLMQRKLSLEWTRSIKKHMNRLKAAETFSDFLALGLGHPEPLEKPDTGKYSLRVNANVRLIIKLNATNDTVMICSEIIIEGVVDYHGEKKTWYIH